MSTNSTTKEYRLSQWFPIVKTCRESGMTVKAWCEQHDVNEKQFYYWQRRLSEAASESLVDTRQHSKLVQVPSLIPNKSRSSKSSFDPDLIIRIGEVSVELSENVSTDFLSRVLKVIADV